MRPLSPLDYSLSLGEIACDVHHEHLSFETTWDRVAELFSALRVWAIEGLYSREEGSNAAATLSELVEYIDVVCETDRWRLPNMTPYDLLRNAKRLISLQIS